MLRLAKNKNSKTEFCLKFSRKFLKQKNASPDSNDCVLSLRVPITGIHILSGTEKSRPPPIGAGEIDGLPDASKAELRVKVPQIWRHFLYS